MPSIRTLSRSMKINPYTIHRAYQELKKQGYLYSVKGKGYYVAPIDPNSVEQKIEKEIKPELQRLLQAAIYLGLKEEELIKWYKEIDDANR
jgi:GntR family transcriptional regulator